MGLLDALKQYIADALPGGLLNPETKPVANQAKYIGGLLDPNSPISQDAQNWHKRTQIGLADQLAGRQTPEAEQAYQTMMQAAGIAPVGMIVWHGSKHLFPPTVKSKLGEFDLSKVRTGDGTNLQGVGTYLADVQDVGKRYAGNNGYLYKVDLPDDVIPRMFNLDEPILSQSHLRTELNSIHEKNPDLKERIFDAAKQGKNGQYMYDTIMEKFARDLKAKGMTGEDIYHQANEMTSKVFKESGIQGVKYLDRASRESGKGTSNYVVYDPAILKILDRSSN